MFYQNWKLSLIAIIMIPLASIAARTLGKRMGKKLQHNNGCKSRCVKYLFNGNFKNHKLMKIFQKENYEKKRADEYINNFKETSRKIKYCIC